MAINVERSPEGWKPTGEQGWYRANIHGVASAPGFSQFSEQSRSRWDLFGWLKKKINQRSTQNSSSQK